MQDLIFVLNDREGTPHQYIVSPHGADGLEVIDAMLLVGLGPAAQGIFAATRKAKAEAEHKAQQKAASATPDEDAEEAELTLADLMESMDLDAVLSALQRGISSAGGMRRLAPLVLRHTSRDGQRLFTADTNARDHDTQFTMAYAQNWKEMTQAFRKAMEINDFFGALAGFFSGI